MPMNHSTPQIQAQRASLESEMMQPKAETINKLLMFAACYHVEKTDNNTIFEIFLN